MLQIIWFKMSLLELVIATSNLAQNGITELSKPAQFYNQIFLIVTLVLIIIRYPLLWVYNLSLFNII